MLTRRQFSSRVAALAALASLPARRAFGEPADIAHDAESIHDEVQIAAPPAKVYSALTNAAMFTKMTTFSMVKDAPPAKIDAKAGGAFALFGGHIEGRNVELVTDTRVVQAWRAANWDPGWYSIARFVLNAKDGGTLIVFDHVGFPKGEADHLEQGWTANYWEPMKKLLVG